MLRKILTALLERLQVFLQVSLMERLARCNVRSSTMHLQRAGGSNYNSRIGCKTTDTALDVAEFLHAHVSAESAFGEDEAFAGGIVAGFGTCQFESNTVCENG